MKKKNILILTTEFPPQPGGIGEHSYQLATYLNRLFNITLVTDQRSELGKEEKTFDAKLSFEVKRVKRNSFIALTYFKRILISLKNLKEVDVILVSGKFSLWQIHLLKLICNKPVIAIIHGSEVLLSNKLLRKFTNKALEKSDHIIGVSKFTLGLVKHLKLKETSVVPNGVVINTKLNKNNLDVENKRKAPQLITVGNLTRRKGQHNMIKALPTLLKSYPNLHYHCVGIPTEIDKLKKLANTLNVSEAITFYGRVSEERKNELYKKSDIFVMLSEQTETGDVEGFGIAILEANCFGLPALGSLNSGIEDAIKQGYSGFLVHPHAVEEISKNIKTILKDYKGFQHRARQWAEGFNWENIGSQYKDIIDKV